MYLQLINICDAKYMRNKGNMRCYRFISESIRIWLRKLIIDFTFLIRVKFSLFCPWCHISVYHDQCLMRNYEVLKKV